MLHTRRIVQILTCLVLVLDVGLAHAQAQLRSGPMLGYNTMREVAVWMQTDQPASVQLRYWPISDVKDVHYSASAKTSVEDALTATLLADSLRANVQYEYQVLVNGRAFSTEHPLRFKTQPNWAFRTDPPDVTIALGSCVYANEPEWDRPGKAYGGGYSIFNAIDSLNPDLMLWLGDNIYLRPGDFQSRQGILHRYSHARAIPELKNLLRNTHHYAIWDDHDYGPNDSDRSYVHKDWTREAFDLFWANPPSGIKEIQPGIGTSFVYGDAHFFLLDNRTFRSPNKCKTCEPMDLIGQAQLNWLVESLAASLAKFKFVLIGGQVLNTAEVWENYAHHHAAEREQLISRIAAEGIKNVVFLTGDRHHTELSRLKRGTVLLHDFTVSPMVSGAAKTSKGEGNLNRVPDTWVGQRNFGTITLSGPFEQRSATLRVFDNRGNQLWEEVLK